MRQAPSYSEFAKAHRIRNAAPCSFPFIAVFMRPTLLADKQVTEAGYVKIKIKIRIFYFGTGSVSFSLATNLTHRKLDAMGKMLYTCRRGIRI